MKQVLLLRWTEGLSDKELTQLCSILNKNQKHESFRFVPYDNSLRFPPTRGVDHIYTYDQLYKVIKETKTFIKHRVGIISMPLVGACFNKQSVSEHVGVVTLHDVEEYKIKELSTRKYLSYLVLCVAMCLVTDLDLEEDHVPNKCLFDFCGEKKTFRECLSKPLICPSCLEKLSEKLDNNEIADMKSIFKYATRKNFFAVLWATIKSATFFYGMLTSSLFTLSYKLINSAGSTPEVWVFGGAILILLIIAAFRKFKK